MAFLLSSSNGSMQCRARDDFSQNYCSCIAGHVQHTSQEKQDALAVLVSCDTCAISFCSYGAFAAVAVKIWTLQLIFIFDI